MSLISRRSVVSLGVLASATSLFPRQLAALLLPRRLVSEGFGDYAVESATTVSDLLAVTPACDAPSEVLLNRLFPGILSDSGFQKVRPLSFLVTNVTNEDIRAFSSQWTVTTPNNRYGLTVMHYFHPRAGNT